MADTKQQPDAKADDKAEKKAPSSRTWIADNFEGVTYVHGVDGPGTSTALQAGDEIPAAAVEQVKSHIPTTDTQPRSQRLREFDAEIGGSGVVPDFDPRDHTVPEVNAHLAEHPTDVQRILELERAGAGRLGILRRD